MKPATVVLSLILILMLAFAAFFYTGGTLKAQGNSITAGAAEYPDAFDSIRNVVSSGAAPRQFSQDVLDDPANYSLVDVTINLTNRGIFAAEWLNVQLEPATGDVAVYSLSGDGMDVSARSTAQVNLKLVTRAPAGSPRTVSIQYYVYGVSRTIRLEI